MLLKPAVIDAVRGSKTNLLEIQLSSRIMSTSNSSLILKGNLKVNSGIRECVVCCFSNPPQHTLYATQAPMHLEKTLWKCNPAVSNDIHMQ